MHVIAYSTPPRPDWTWRIINNAGEVVEESRTRYPTISAAVSEGEVVNVPWPGTVVPAGWPGTVVPAA